MYSLLGLFFDADHKKYTLFFASVILTMYSLLSFLPRKLELLSLVKIEPFYAISILLLLIHLGFVLGVQFKIRGSKKLK